MLSNIMSFNPNFVITSKIAGALMRIEAAKQVIQGLPITPTVLATLRETARLYSTHYSTMIEGNQLIPSEVALVIEHQGHFPGRERDEKEVLGYYAALEKVEQLAAKGGFVTAAHIQTLHALVMAGGRKKIKPTSYRDGQNVIRDGKSHAIVSEVEMITVIGDRESDIDPKKLQVSSILCVAAAIRVLNNSNSVCSFYSYNLIRWRRK